MLPTSGVILLDQSTFFILLPLPIKIVAEVVTLLIIDQIRSSLGGSDDNVGAFE